MRDLTTASATAPMTAVPENGTAGSPVPARANGRAPAPAGEPGRGAEVGAASPTSPAGTSTWRTVALRATVVAFTFAVVVLFLEYGLSHTGVKEFVVPKPSSTVEALSDNWGAVLAPALWFTVREIVFGLVIGVLAGVLLAILIDAVALLEYVILPYVIAGVVTPMIAMVPVVFLQFGEGLPVRIGIVAFAAAPMMMLNTLSGLRRTPAIRLDVMRAMRATWLQTLWKVKLPSALPTMFTGLLISTIFAVIAGVGTEFVSGDQGLGSRIVYYSSLVQTPIVFAAILLLVAVGLTLFGIVTALQHRFAGWKE